MTASSCWVLSHASLGPSHVSVLMMDFYQVCNRKHWESFCGLSDSHWWSKSCSCCCCRAFLFPSVSARIYIWTFEPLIKGWSADCWVPFIPVIQPCTPISHLWSVCCAQEHHLCPLFTLCALLMTVQYACTVLVLIWHLRLHPFQGPFILPEQCKWAVVACILQVKPPLIRKGSVLSPDSFSGKSACRFSVFVYVRKGDKIGLLVLEPSVRILTHCYGRRAVVKEMFDSGRERTSQ